MNKRILAIIFVVLAFVATPITVYALANLPSTDNEAKAIVVAATEENIPSEPIETVPMESLTPAEEIIVLDVVAVERVEPSDYEEATTLLEKADARYADANTLKETLISLGYAEDHLAVVMSNTEIANAEEEVNYYTEQKDNLYEEYRWKVKSEEYPTATYVWKYMKDLGWSDAVCAGIMGNMMAEVGGGTLSLRYDIYSADGFYGLCQWGGHYPEVRGASLEGQCNFLRDTIKYELDTFGYAYSGGMNYDSFLQLTSPSDVALCFAKCYERCASFSYGARQSYAEQAYAYFVN